ncbi:MAG: TlpA family protein disulfide reductase [Nitrospirae bacterium]|nr:TlpA family protein disulfide reductase [Nitrospirota bacterium]MCL5421175.1 TlpA family protein disulfide reductase [Nitrospirota bacterium]
MKAKAIIIVVIILAALMVLLFGVRKQETRLPKAAIEGLAAPELILSDPSGKLHSLSELRGSVVFVNFWATWCPPCREEMPSIQNLYNQFKDQKEFRMVTILYRDDYQKAMAYLKENNYDFPVVVDTDEKTARAYGVTGVPETYIVDKKGILKQKRIGPFDWTSPQAISLMSDLVRQ